MKKFYNRTDVTMQKNKIGTQMRSLWDLDKVINVLPQIVYANILFQSIYYFIIHLFLSFMVHDYIWHYKKPTKISRCAGGHSITTWTRWGGRGSKNICFCPRRGGGVGQKMPKFCPRSCWMPPCANCNRCLSSRHLFWW